MATKLLRGVAERAQGLFVQDSDEEIDDAGVEALLVRTYRARCLKRRRRTPHARRPAS